MSSEGIRQTAGPASGLHALRRGAGFDKLFASMSEPQGLPAELRQLVKRSVAVLGEVLREKLGAALFDRIEGLRRDMAALRGASADETEESLARHLAQLRELAASDRLSVAHAFSSMLELMNACENAYRTHRLRRRPPRLPTARPKGILYVLTAHPTEARSPASIAVFHAIHGVLVRALAEGFERHEPALRHWCSLAVQLASARREKPAVEDEAEHLYSIVLRPETLGALLEASREVGPVYIRSWVGGDKDGHPGVDETSMRNSLQLSRTRLLAFAHDLLAEVERGVVLGGASVGSALSEARRALRDVAVLRAGDGARATAARRKVRVLFGKYVAAIGAPHPALVDLDGLTKMFPALVVPLELREASDVIEGAAAGEPSAIARMLAELKSVSKGGAPRWYARGLIVSMASSIAHVKAAARVMKEHLGALKIPVIPLFEQREAIEGATTIAEGMLADPALRAAVDEHWDGHFEVMLGYSDSAKVMGVLPSRLAIASAVGELDALLTREKVTPVFFHGSGGSVDRGGGSIQEQTAWWPRSALELYKATVQGEMVERSFASPEIARSRLDRIAEEGASRASAPALQVVESPALRAFADLVSRAYAEKIAEPSFLEVIQRATAYRYLSVLRIGSRPTKRGAVTSVEGLRAIPWVLSWTQVRLLFPTWWGVGTAWRAQGPEERKALAAAYEGDPLFRSFVKSLGFTLAKVELGVFRAYLATSGLEPQLVDRTRREIEAELAGAVELVKALSGSDDLLWFRPWLGASIALRSPMIHPLNLLQITALADEDAALIRETVAGIASGMLTTG